MARVLATILLAVSFAYGAPTDAHPKRMKPMLLVIDVQNHYLKYMSDENREQALEMINGALWLFRKYKLPVCRVYTDDPALGLKPDSDAYEYPAAIVRAPGDLVLKKRYYCAFKDTDLEKLLADNGCNTVFICGLNAVSCVMATYFGATERDITAFLVKGAVMSHKSKYIGFVEDIMESVSFNTLKVMLENIAE